MDLESHDSRRASTGANTVVHAEFVTDHDTEDALLEWVARRRREVIPGPLFMAGVAALGLGDVSFLWRHESSLSFALLFAMLTQAGAVAMMVIARDPDRERALPCPYTELIATGLVALSLAVTFEHRTSIAALVMLTLALAVFGALAAFGWHGISPLRDRVPFYGRAIHVRCDANGLDVTLRPAPKPRHIAWSSIRYLGADAGSLFVVAGGMPVVVPRRAFPTPDAWRAFVDTAADHAGAALKPADRSPMWRHVRIRSPKARRA